MLVLLTMYVLNAQLFRTALKNAGFRSLTALAEHLGIHRNTAQYYMNGAPVLNDKLNKMLDAVSLSPREAFIRLEEDKGSVNSDIVQLADRMSAAMPGVIAVVLFGSRSRESAHKYSDFDIGVYAKKGLAHKEFLGLFRYKDEFEEESPYIIDLVNLNAVDASFRKAIRSELRFLSGSGESWLALQNETFAREK
jgi:predicted nucleotidyltransferase